ncbi:YoaK family protein [Rhizobium binxianense]
MRPALPVLLSLTGGYVDTAGFLALGGLFPAHVTGNFVTLGAALTHGTSGIIAKLLALPVFCLTVFLLRYLTRNFEVGDARGFRLLLMVKLAFLIAGGLCAVWLAPFDNPDGLPLVLTGMLLVIAMAIQNAAHRIHLGSAPPSTLMTGTTTQIMIDLADLTHGGVGDQAKTVNGRLSRMAVAVAAFALGCGLAAFLFATVGTWCFALPPLFAVVAICLTFSPPQAA